MKCNYFQVSILVSSTFFFKRKLPAAARGAAQAGCWEEAPHPGEALRARSLSGFKERQDSAPTHRVRFLGPGAGLDEPRAALPGTGRTRGWAPWSSRRLHRWSAAPPAPSAGRAEHGVTHQHTPKPLPPPPPHTRLRVTAGPGVPQP